MIKFNKNINQFILIIILGLVLFLINSNGLNNHKLKRINDIYQNDLVNNENISPKELFNECWRIVKLNHYDRTLNKQNWSRWKKRYKDQIKTKEDAYIAINTMLLSLDDSYSKFMSKEEFSAQNNAINSKLYGIGINIASSAGKIYIINVLKGAPADNAGLKAGDVILKIDNQNTKGESIYKIANLIKGNLKESVELEILRDKDKFTKTIKRQEIKTNTIESEKITDDIGYIKIPSFIGTDCPKEFIIALNRLKNTKGLILDLRGNSGGLFQNAVVISNLFMKKGEIVSVIARGGKKNIYNANAEGCIYSNPLVILIDDNTASSAEILSSALRDNHRAILIGTKTYGKGLVQKIFSLPNQTGMNLTIAKYITPSGFDIDKRGIEPDYTVNITKNDFINNTDSQLNKAKTLLEKEIKEQNI